MAMIEALRGRARSSRATRIIEPTCGNTGIALAFVAAAKGYKLILTMPETHVASSGARCCCCLGAELVLTPAEKGMKGAIARAEELVERDARARSCRSSSRTPPTRRSTACTTAEEIWNDTDGSVDILISGVGTGGTITGVGQVLKERKPSLQDDRRRAGGLPGAVAAASPARTRSRASAPGFVPDDPRPRGHRRGRRGLQRRRVKMAKRAWRAAGRHPGRHLVRRGAIGGAASARGPRTPARMVAIIPSFAERYLSTALFEGLD